MRRLSAALPALAVALVLFVTVGGQPTVADPAPAPAAAPPSQSLPPGAVKTPGAKCATVIQPPEYQGCPGPPGDLMPDGTRYCQGAPVVVGECLAAEAGFFNPPANFQPRNRSEACIAQRESGDSYNPWPPGDGGQRWQFEQQTWDANGGQPGSWSQASPAEQDHVFVETGNNDGDAPWTSYDGC